MDSGEILRRWRSYDECPDFYPVLMALIAERDKYRETLQWYADRGPTYSVHEAKMVPTFSDNEAKRARQALAPNDKRDQE